MPDRIETEVAIIGLGPVGSTLANLLGRRGIDVVAIERDPAVHDMPRAVVFDHEAMRAFQSAGLAGRILPHTVKFDRSIYLGAKGQVIKKLVTAPPPFELGWSPNYLFSQPAVDQVLRDTAAEWPSVEVWLGAEVVGVAEDAAGDAGRVTLQVRSQDGAMREIAARYVVACDGGSSPMRRRLGIGFHDLEFDEPWLVVDALVDDAHLPALPRTNVQYCDPVRPATHVAGPGNHRRWEIMLLPGETPEEMNREERIWQLLARWISPKNAKLWRASAYRFHALVAKEWHRGRIVIAGDAAHMTPPFLGQGMCQGLRDAANLAWKLEAILRRAAPAGTLLASYGDERGPHVRETTKVARGLGRIICELDPVKAAARDAALLAEGEPREEIRQTLIPNLSSGILSRTSGQTAAGTIFPQPRVRHRGSEMLMDDVTGSGFRLVSDGLDIAQLSDDPSGQRLGVALVSLAAGATAPVTVIDERDGQLADWFKRQGARIALVRPDHYVFGTASNIASARELLAEAHEMIFG
jgi:3-(3-hydroxy-phenyl)propionate hydroxylase